MGDSLGRGVTPQTPTPRRAFFPAAAQRMMSEYHTGRSARGRMQPPPHQPMSEPGSVPWT
ncbi:MAG: hypothetical protein AUH85_10450 [Chloroflexi bacterium 13_1_40CM_4_68_4]|nr:MAG: hypothetical protein AUH85_10450 [Chloroflexi bacterium 13_1_40CM_4_68_4]